MMSKPFLVIIKLVFFADLIFFLQFYFNIFFCTKMFGSNFGPKKCWSEIILGKKKLGWEKNWVKKNRVGIFWVKQDLGQKKFCVKKI